MIGVEIINSKNKNILCCCVYRHPNSDVQEFTHFVNGILQTVTKENKHIFFLGDFNLNLLNYEHHSDTNDFLNSMVSHLLPHILHPTRVTDHSATIIDDIFSNITDFETKSGNILCEISDHYPKFIILDKVIPDYKFCSFAKRNYSNFDEIKFIEDFSAMDLDILHDSNAPVNEKFNCFYDKLSNLVDTHVPSKRMAPKEILARLRNHALKATTT